ncbi:MAG: hypothetical protein JWO05_348 [Gemmatimonadetes bacterium]|nr:hypothetical protein [Gemmatimonadota bacterium]
MRDPENLRVYRQAVALAVELGLYCERFPRPARILIPQIRLAANSVHANIAEGYKRGSQAQFAQALDIAHGSVAELRSHLVEAFGQCPELKRLFWGIREAESIDRQIASLIRTVRGRWSADGNRPDAEETP